MSLFDGIQSAAFAAASNVFGDVAVWTPSGSQVSQSEKVLFKNPNDPVSIGEADKYEYRPYGYSIEYYNGKFSGLKESVDNGNLEYVSVKGYNLIIRQVVRKFDGQTFTAYGELKSND